MSKPTVEQLRADIMQRPIASNASNTKVTEQKSEIVSKCFVDVVAKPIDWLWPNFIARGRLTVIGGHPGLGKSQLTANIAAIVSTGGEWPVNGGQAVKGDCLFLGAEDDPADTVKPRLMAAGADLSCTHILESVREAKVGDSGVCRTFCFTKDMDRLDKEIESRKGRVAVVFIDPISAYLGA